MSQRILITGGVGFIGSHVTDELLRYGYDVRVLDSLAPQVHPNGRFPQYLAPEAELIQRDVRDDHTVGKALAGVDAVVHLAAAVGVGQSMDEIRHYTSVNNLGTAVLVEALARQPVKRLVVASSMSVYGEGAYVDEDGRPCETAERPPSQLRAQVWEVESPIGSPLRPVPTPETKRPSPVSVYALSKYDQERMCLLVGTAYGIETVALRLFNVYGPRQALSNPYTGVMAIFASRDLKGLAPVIDEDGLQRRDFVSAYDVARAFRLALEVPDAAGSVFNIGSGRSVTVLKVAQHLARVLDCDDIQPQITQQYRPGDIRHCFADVSLARRRLGYEPQVDFADGLAELAQWLRGQVSPNESRIDKWTAPRLGIANRRRSSSREHARLTTD